MGEITPKEVTTWLTIEEGSIYDYLNDYKKQPLRREAIWYRLLREKKKLSMLKNKLSLLKNDLKNLIAKKVLEFKEINNPKSAAAVESFRKTEVEADPEVQRIQKNIIDIEYQIMEQEDVVSTWQVYLSLLKEKSNVLEYYIQLEMALGGKSKDSMIENL